MKHPNSDILAFEQDLLHQQKDIDPEFISLVDDNFWGLAEVTCATAIPTSTLLYYAPKKKVVEAGDLRIRLT